MQAVAFYIALPFLYLISILPLRVLFFISDLLVFPLLYHVLAYRRKVVQVNLINAFPEKSALERAGIEKRYYRYLSDLFMETVKMFTISYSELTKRMVFEFEPAYQKQIDEWFENGQNMIITSGHYGNYEWLVQSLNIHYKHQLKAPYREMSNPYFNDFFAKCRAKFGAILFPTHKTMQNLRSGEIPYLLGLANDQSAPPDTSYWTTFLNQDTSFFVGAEKIARKFNYPVSFAKISRLKRGYYKVNVELITAEGKGEREGYISERHANLLEQQIIEKPEFWLWSHRRWKHKKPAGVEKGFTAKL